MVRYKYQHEGFNMDKVENKSILYVGTYTENCESKGIYTLEFDKESNDVEVLHTCRGEKNPSFLIKSGSTIYAAHEISDQGYFASYDVRKDGSLKLISSYRSKGDAETCYLLEHPDGYCIYGANYKSGSISSCQVLPDKRLGEGFPSEFHRGSSVNKDRQSSPHVHTLSFIPQTRWLVAVDLGMDALVMYCTDDTGVIQTPPLEMIDVPAGSGPRMLAYHPNLPIAALINELSNDILLCHFDETGRKWELDQHFELLQIEESRKCDYTCGQDDILAAHIVFSSDGRYLYASVRGSDMLCRIDFNDKGEMVEQEFYPSGGEGPRHFAISPDGNYMAVANQDSGNVAIFKLANDKCGITQLASISIPQPSCIVWNE